MYILIRQKLRYSVRSVWRRPCLALERLRGVSVRQYEKEDYYYRLPFIARTYNFNRWLVRARDWLRHFGMATGKPSIMLILKRMSRAEHLNWQLLLPSVAWFPNTVQHHVRPSYASCRIFSTFYKKQPTDCSTRPIALCLELDFLMTTYKV